MKPPFSIRVPGSTSNLGPGFDSIGLAVNRYLQLDVFPAENWQFHPRSSEVIGIPADEQNLIYQAAEFAAEQNGRRASDMQPCEVFVSSEIPMARGLGSSGAAITAGIELADQLLALGLAKAEKVRIGSLFEGHPDNVSASYYGGCAIGFHTSEDTKTVQSGVPDLDIVAVIPNYELRTKDARNVLPEQFSRRQAVSASAVTNVLVAAFFQKDWILAGQMMEQDSFHEPFRASLVPELELARKARNKVGAYSAVLSGAGPTVLFFVPKGKAAEVQETLALMYPEWHTECMEPAEKGLAVLQQGERV
ncbi:homoserine kinase [Bacillus marinisedimentorum]|uniref:homoserine kinase n=1 Tax=Bacillus marinisedimentorum TaxID=1821260 RepID=UPI0008731094|nr:homoserine kinase [Bacillus marinisedimentorum]